MVRYSKSKLSDVQRKHSYQISFPANHEVCNETFSTRQVFPCYHVAPVVLLTIAARQNQSTRQRESLAENLDFWMAFMYIHIRVVYLS